MQQATIAILLGLLAGFGGGALAVQILGPGGAATAADGGPDTAGRDLAARIQVLEDRLEIERATLRGSAPGTVGSAAPGATVPGNVLSPETRDALVQELAEKVGEHLDERIEKKIEEAAGEADPMARLREPKPRVSLAEAAEELGLSAAEEDDLRQIFTQHEERMLKMLAGKDGDPEEVRRDLARAAEDESTRPELMQKYMPRVVGNLAQVMKIETTKHMDINKAIGPEKAGKLRGMNVAEADSFGFRGSMRIEGAGGGR